MKLALPASQLLEASDYRGFLATLYKINKENSSQFSYAYIGKQCGFSSKSFIKEVIDGKKKLSLESVQKITKGLNLPSLWGKYFACLVNGDEKEIRRLRARLLDSKIVVSENKGEKAFQQSQWWPYVYAALGTVEQGANLQEIVERTGLPEASVKTTLDMLVAEKMVTLKGRRYLASSDTAFYDRLGKSQFFKNFYMQSLNKIYEKARKRFDSQEALFYSMSLSVKSEKMPQFKQDLMDLLDKYTAEIEDPRGNRVASVVCGFDLI